MTATTIDRPTKFREGRILSLPVAATTKIPAGVIVGVTTSGWAVNGAATATNRTAGVARAMADNSGGANGDVKVEVRRGVWGPFANSSAGDQITAADVLANCYVVDNQTVAKTDGSASRPVAGKVIEVDAAGGVWVDFG